MNKITIFLALTLICGSAFAQKLGDVSKQLRIFNQLYKTLDEYYVDTLNPEKNISTAVNSMLEDLDPYTEYYTPSSAKDFNTMITGKYAGVGAIIHYYKAADRCVIYQLYEGNPAQKAGLKVGDILLSIDGKDLGKRGKQDINSYTSSVSQKLRGDPNTTITVTVKRPGVDSVISLQVHRAAVQMPCVPYFGMIDGETGYIYLNSFTADCSQDVLSAFQNLKKRGMKKLVFDLRSNGGGSANEAVKIVNMFVPRGKLILTMKGKTPSSNTSYATQSEPQDLQMPLVVLVNGSSASASEITCGSLQDLDRAVILGERTFGKGLVQQTRELPGGAMLKLTTSHYYIPSGRCIQALDYSHRTSSGEAYRTPDSLTSLFHTEAGRPVRDGGGIVPDVVVKSDTMPTALVYLVNSDEYFDWLNSYCLRHPSISQPEEFALSDADYQDLIDSLAHSSFAPEYRSLGVIKQLRSLLKAEEADSLSRCLLDSLERSLKPDISRILIQHKTLMKERISTDICDRYYYNTGAIRNMLTHDPQLKAALSLLGASERYSAILNPKMKGAESKVKSAEVKVAGAESAKVSTEAKVNGL